MLTTKLRQWARKCAARSSTAKTYTLPSAEFQRALCDDFCAQDTGAIERALTAFNRADVKVAFDSSAVWHPMSCAWSRTDAHGSCFAFLPPQPGHLLNTVVNRWLSLWELFVELDRPESPTGKTVINFNDAGVEPGLAFSADSPDYTLIPDPDFFKSHGYAQAREHFAKDRKAWDRRSATILWRGSSLGQKHHAILDMPRARLCQIAKAAPDNWCDFGIVDVFDVTESDAVELRAAELIKERVRWKQYNNYRFHIDIDGHANSFAGLFLKLLSGGLVLKVASPNGYTQWYYDRLRPWENFVPVRSDLSDLLEVASYCREHDDLAQQLAQNGRELALSMTFDREFASAVESVKNAFACSSN